jgi:hypothetical protein
VIGWDTSFLDSDSENDQFIAARFNHLSAG